MAVDDYIEFSTGLKRLAGVDLSSYKRQQMERRIRSYVQRKAVPTLGEYLRQLERSADELDQFLDRITINVSELYRNPEQYETLRTKVIPDLKKAAAPLKVWSAGCSYGAEAYTLATMLNEELAGGRFEVVGSDIDKRIVARAQRGWFAEADMRSVPPKIRDKYFDPFDGGYQAKSLLKGHLRFRLEDLLRDRFQTGWDLVLCRNVVIYFTDEARDQVHQGIARAIRPGGYLMVGATERVSDPKAIGLEPAHPFIYRKVS
jgi:chemotaxis protein methyltransferase CheR